MEIFLSERALAQWKRGEASQMVGEGFD